MKLYKTRAISDSHFLLENTIPGLEQKRVRNTHLVKTSKGEYTKRRVNVGRVSGRSDVNSRGKLVSASASRADLSFLHILGLII